MKEVDLNRFLAWLDPDHDQAALNYEEIRNNLIRILSRRGCPNASDLADKAFDRVILHLPKFVGTYDGPPSKYIIRVAINLCSDERSRLGKQDTLPNPNTKNAPVVTPKQEEEKWERERRHQCLEACLQKLPDGKRELILDYYQKQGAEKIANRQRLAEYLGISLNALAIRVLRIRESLEACILECLQAKNYSK
jgi:RNA polymerase sigma factor (sigma-70 family)